jgi:hypothetical protein
VLFRLSPEVLIGLRGLVDTLLVTSERRATPTTRRPALPRNAPPAKTDTCGMCSREHDGYLVGAYAALDRKATDRRGLQQFV